MRFSPLILPLLLAFSIHILLVSSESPQDSLIGEWSDPKITTNVGGYCCVPTSITIKNKSLNSYTVTCNYPGLGENGYDSKCHGFFNNRTNGTMTISRGNSSEDHRSDHSVSSMIMYFQALGLGLNVHNKPYSSMIESEACEFTMTSRNALRPFKPKLDQILICMMVFCALIIMALFGFHKSYGSVVQQNHARNNLIISHDDVTPNPGSSESPSQVGYVAPGQFVAVPAENNA